MERIEVEGIKLFGYHGCLDEEGLIGTDYRANVTVWGHLRSAAASDNLKDTLDYVTINKVVSQEMAIRSKLIENVAKRILDRLMEEMPQIQKAEIKLSKLHPPINGDVESVSVVMSSEH
ncbi:MAG: dihydroneopterin aldolase [Owenweeksia sp.]|nr:dihydroneopterin aldolase [Owenweeksia sp.]